MNELISFLENQDVEYKTGKVLSNCTSIGIGGAAKLFISPNSKEKLIKTLSFLHQNKIAYRVLGNMSNILPSDSEVETVIVSTLKLCNVTAFGTEIFAECGALFSKLLLLALRHSLGGAEALFGIPGTVGAMICNNSGAYGASISDFLNTVSVYDASEASVTELRREEIGFFYRDSEIKRQGLIVLDATFSFASGVKNEIDISLKKIKKQRMDTQPIGMKTLGSVFKRTDNLPASYMIDRCGLKGERSGNIVVSSHHAGFFVNEGGGTAEDFLRLVETVKEKVFLKYGVILQEEFEYLT